MGYTTESGLGGESGSANSLWLCNKERTDQFNDFIYNNNINIDYIINFTGGNGDFDNIGNAEELSYVLNNKRWFGDRSDNDKFDNLSDENKLKANNALSKVQKEYDKLEHALVDVREKGYGMVTPTMEDMVLEEPELTKKGGSFCVRLKASAPTLHIIRSDVTTEITPLMGSEKQCEDLVRYMSEKFEQNPLAMWEYDIFGKSLHDLVRENMEGKLQKMPENVQHKLQEAVRRITNDGSGGLICIII